MRGQALRRRVLEVGGGGIEVVFLDLARAAVFIFVAGIIEEGVDVEVGAPAEERDAVVGWRRGGVHVGRQDRPRYHRSFDRGAVRSRRLPVDDAFGYSSRFGIDLVGHDRRADVDGFTIRIKPERIISLGCL